MELIASSFRSLEFKIGSVVEVVAVVAATAVGTSWFSYR